MRILSTIIIVLITTVAIAKNLDEANGMAYSQDVRNALFTVNIDPNESHCLAQNIYFEAGNQSLEGMAAVADVTINRKDNASYPNTICEVVYQPKQFSWTHLIKDHTPMEKKAWKKARVIARDVMIGNVDDPTHGAVFYHANYVNPDWASFMDLSKVIGNHLFYTWDGDWNAAN